jgi:hypothetical protein
MQTLCAPWYFSHFRQKISLPHLQSCKKTASAMPILSPTPFQMCLRVGLLSRDAPADITRGNISPPILDDVRWRQRHYLMEAMQQPAGMQQEDERTARREDKRAAGREAMQQPAGARQQEGSAVRGQQEGGATSGNTATSRHDETT